MSSKQEIINEVRQHVPADVTESVIEQALDSFGNDKAKVIEFFQDSIGGAQVNASFDQVVKYLRETVPIEGTDIRFYEECVRQANSDISVALDLLYKAREKKLAEKRSASKPLPTLPKGPTASPIVVPPVYQPSTSDKKPLPEPEIAKPLPPNPAEEPKPAEPKDDSCIISAEEDARKKEDDLLKIIEQQNAEAEERQRKAEEWEKRLQELKAKKDRIGALIDASKNDPAKKDLPELEEELHRCEIEHSCIESVFSVKVPPTYLKGRLPTDLCEIEATVKDAKIEFTWKIKDGVELSSKDWIGLYIHDRQYSNKYEKYVLLGGKKEGSATFDAPGPGFFDLRYYQNNGSEEKSRSEPFLVGPKVIVDAELQGRRKICVSWHEEGGVCSRCQKKHEKDGEPCRCAERDGDWIGLYQVSTYSNAQYIQQFPASSANSDGKIMFDAPRQPGEYEVRYFFTSKKHGTGYAFSGVSKHIVIPNEDKMEVIATHPIVKVQWQTFSQVPNNSDWIGLYESSDSKAKRLGWEYTGKKGLMDSVGDHGIAEIEVDCLMRLSADATLPEGSEKWEVRLFNKAPNQPFLRAPFIKPQ